MAEIIVAKHRNGAVDTVKLRFRKEQARFMDFDSDTDSYSAIDSSMNTEFSSTLGAGQGLNDPGGYGNFSEARSATRPHRWEEPSAATRRPTTKDHRFDIPLNRYNR
jgi:hypothetical protein